MISFTLELLTDFGIHIYVYVSVRRIMKMKVIKYVIILNKSKNHHLNGLRGSNVKLVLVVFLCIYHL